MSLRNTLRKAASLLVELPPEEVSFEAEDLSSETRQEATQEVSRVYETLQASQTAAPAKTVEQIVRDAPGPNLDQVQVTEPPMAILNADSTINFDALYQSANLPPAPFSAEQVLATLSALPAELPIESKRQTVKVLIQAMKINGASPENIVADASRKLAALNAYVEHVNKQAGEFIAKSETDILEMERLIEERRKAITTAKEKQERISQLCIAESERLDDVLEFFSLDVPPSRYAADKA